jgi:hypothetical protein
MPPDVAQQNLCIAGAPPLLCQRSNIERQVLVRRFGVTSFVKPHHAYLATIARCAKNRATAPQLTRNSRDGVICCCESDYVRNAHSVLVRWR